MNITHKGYECEVQFGHYYNGNNAIQLVGSKGTEYEGEVVSVASVNGDVELVEDVVGIKTWSENEVIVQSLVKGGVIHSGVIGIEPTGFVMIEHYKLTPNALKEIAKSKEEK